MLRKSLRLLPFLLGAAALLTAGCNQLAPWQPGEELVVAVLDDPVFFQPAAEGESPTGFEADLIHTFAEELQVKVRFIPARSPAQLKELLIEGKAHFATAVPLDWAPEFRHTQALHESVLVIVQHADRIPKDEPEDLVAQAVEVAADGPAQQALDRIATTARFKATVVPDANAMDILGRIQERQADLAATDSLHLRVASNFFPDLTVAQKFDAKIAYGWAFRAEDEALHQRADEFISRLRQNGRLVRLEDRYFGHVHRISRLGAAQFLSDMQTRLPRFRALFEKAQSITGIDWRLLAALAYQESKWDPLATSYTGVRGMMMLTEETADRLRVGNRLDPEESILAGARYLADLIDELPPSIGMPDRHWFALAAYNLGMGHLRGARQFAVGMKRDANSWYDMKKVLPLMAQPEYYERLKAGRARGGEAVILVENVRTYYDILARFEPTNRSPLEPSYVASLPTPPM